MFLLIPLYTRFLTTSDYGILGVTDMVSAVIVIILTLQLAGAITIHYFRLDDNKRRLLISTIWLFFLAIPTGVTIALTAMGGKWFSAMFPNIPFSPYIQIALVVGYLTIFSVIPQILFRLREQPIPYVIFNLAGFGVKIGLSIWFVVGLHMGAIGVLWAFLISNGILAVAYILVILRDVNWTFSWSMLKKSLLLSLPLMPHVLGSWALSLSDRAILQAYVSLSDLGIYRLAFQFSSVYLLFIIAANNAWIPFFFKKAIDRNSWGVIVRLATYLILALTIIGSGIAIFSGDVIRIMTPTIYHPAARIVPLLVLGSSLSIVYLVWVNATVFSKRTGWMAIATVIAASTNVIANILTIPTFGIMAAAVNAVLGNAVLALIHFFVSRRLLPLPHEYGRWAKVGLTAGLLYGLSVLAPKSPTWLSLAARAVVWCSWPVILYFLGFWTEKEYLMGRRILAYLRIR